MESVFLLTLKRLKVEYCYDFFLKIAKYVGEERRKVLGVLNGFKERFFP